MALASSAAWAQEHHAAAAEALFDEGLTLFDAGHYEEACSKFQASQRLDPAVGTLLNLGRCFEKSGMTASAWATYRQVQAVAIREADPRRQQAAHERELALEKRLSMLVIDVAPSAVVPGLVIRRDGSPIDRAEWGVPIPVDPGNHEVEVSADGKKGYTHVVNVAPEARATETVAPLEASEPPDRATGDANNPKGEGRDGRAARRTIALVVGGSAAVAAAIGTYFAVDASSNWSSARTHCPVGGACDPEGASLSRDAGTSADRATVSFAVAATAAVATVILWITSPAPADSAKKTGLRFVPVRDGGGLRLQF
jgi:hypothetical protein